MPMHVAKSLTTPVRVVVAVAGAVIMTSGSVAFGQNTCDVYGRLALGQMQENEQRRCGFKGLEWNTDLKAHMAWCSTVGPDQWKVQLQRREQALAACRVAKKS